MKELKNTSFEIKDNKTIKLGVIDLTFHRATAAVITKVFEILGFIVVRSYSLHEEAFRQLKTGDIDMVASAWLPHSHGIYKEDVEQSVATAELGVHYEPFAYWGVPHYIPQDLVDSVDDLRKPDIKVRMKKVIQGIGPGAGITRFSIQMMEEYALSEAGYSFRLGTLDDCIDAFENLVTEQAWGVVPLWQPQLLNHRHLIRPLKDPKRLLRGADNAVLLARNDRIQVFSPSELKVLANISLSNKVVSELDFLINRENKSADDAADIWLKNNPAILSAWMKPVF